MSAVALLGTAVVGSRLGWWERSGAVDAVVAPATAAATAAAAVETVPTPAERLAELRASAALALPGGAARRARRRQRARSTISRFLRWLLRTKLPATAFRPYWRRCSRVPRKRCSPTRSRPRLRRSITSGAPIPRAVGSRFSRRSSRAGWQRCRRGRRAGAAAAACSRCFHRARERAEPCHGPIAPRAALEPERR